MFNLHGLAPNTTAFTAPGWTRTSRITMLVGVDQHSSPAFAPGSAGIPPPSLSQSADAIGRQWLVGLHTWVNDHGIRTCQLSAYFLSVALPLLLLRSGLK